jgi:hypothetical protein
MIVGTTRGYRTASVPVIDVPPWVGRRSPCRGVERPQQAATTVFLALRLPARLLAGAPDRAVHLVEGAIDVAHAPVKVAAIDLNRGAAFRARQRWATAKLADGAGDGRAAVAVEVDLLAVEVESAHPVSRSHWVDDVELGAVVYAVPVLVSRLALVPNLLTDRHAGAGLLAATPARDPRRRVDVGEFMQR